MGMIDHIVMKNCRLCHSKPGLHDINNDKKLIKDIYECIKVKVNDKLMEFLPHSVCDECKKTIKTFSLFKQYVRKVDQSLRKVLKNAETKKDCQEQFKCRECPAEFNDSEVFKKHVYSHSANFSIKENIPCSVCKVSFKCLDEFGSHQCGAENQEIKAEDAENDELVRDNGDSGDNSDVDDSQNQPVKNVKYICTYNNCKKILSSAYTLKTHHLKHQGKRSFLCVTCVRSNLRAHEKKHHEGVRFYCSQCTKAFCSKCSLERHERIHTGIKDFKCQACPSAFYTKKELLKHQRYHQGIRLHKCDECFKTFYERHHLTIHLRSHTGERPYVCTFPDCGKSFTESQKLKRHHNAKHTQT
ncbi:zinc finger imprinted 3-like isoform X2 [Zophobas morio]|uniref:zinc finger imprinted 3-like isoform X2 n=1 Tax=Zophobas morio TaxID=2755281 RepID=UPI00308309FA